MQCLIPNFQMLETSVDLMEGTRTDLNTLVSLGSSEMAIGVDKR